VGSILVRSGGVVTIVGSECVGEGGELDPDCGVFDFGIGVGSDLTTPTVGRPEGELDGDDETEEVWNLLIALTG
jgi:hypothetical protein